MRSALNSDEPDGGAPTAVHDEKIYRIHEKTYVVRGVGA
jgi:hypothetical protein